ncbi:hypothetical protein PsorP6_016092 [Peronosclerospora sorghi]|uniref:Uncharacterized protein n=1 Tax=Peronosclerospora sorghi TaxID=230839 RepID=A0ACC0WMX7_9STRA|nr:hypothetical protein PsorP6_016092 [Peronosclerospora sorghi]
MLLHPSLTKVHVECRYLLLIVYYSNPKFSLLGTSSTTPLPTPPSNNPLHTLSDSQKLRPQNFGVLMKKRTKVDHCPSCKERWPNMAIRQETGMCRRCHGEYKSNVVHKFSSANNMDPVPVPAELDGITYVESMLIARVHLIIGCHILKGGRYGYRGHVINFPQNVSPIAQELPRLVSSIETLIIRCEHTDDNDYTDFRVRRQKVQDALLWMIQNNRYYAHLRINEDNLNSLRSDGNVAHLLPTTTAPNSPSRNGQGPPQEDDAIEDEDAIMGGSFVPSRAQERTETEHLVQAVRGIVNRNANNTHEDTEHLLNWPTTSDTPINEFQTEGYISQAFPHLYPTGAADFLAPRLVKVKPSKYFKHLMKYEDGRFGRDPRFRYFALNVCMRWQALTAGRVYIRQHPSEATMSAEDVLERLHNESSFAKKLFCMVGLFGDPSSTMWSGRWS